MVLDMLTAGHTRKNVAVKNVNKALAHITECNFPLNVKHCLYVASDEICLLIQQMCWVTRVFYIVSVDNLSVVLPKFVWRAPNLNIKEWIKNRGEEESKLHDVNYHKQTS